jgi:hypothetical protein
LQRSAALLNTPSGIALRLDDRGGGPRDDVLYVCDNIYGVVFRIVMRTNTAVRIASFFAATRERWQP